MTADEAQPKITAAVPPVVAGRTLNYAPGKTEPALPVPPEWTGVEEFRLAPERMQSYLTIMIAINVVTMLVMGLSILAFVSWKFENTLDARERLIRNLMYMIIFAVWQVTKAVRLTLRTRKEWPLFRLVLADQGLLLARYKKPLVRVDRSDVVEISENFDAFQLRLRGGAKRADVTARVAGVERVRERLLQWQPFTPKRGMLKLLLTIGRTWVFSLAAMALVLSGMSTDNVWVLAGCTAASWMLAALITFPVWRSVSIRLRVKLIVGIYFVLSLLLALRLVMMLAQVSGK